MEDRHHGSKFSIERARAQSQDYRISKQKRNNQYPHLSYFHTSNRFDVLNDSENIDNIIDYSIKDNNNNNVDFYTNSGENNTKINNNNDLYAKFYDDEKIYFDYDILYDESFF